MWDTFSALKTNDFDYDLPPECIAQHPIEPRDAARLLVLNRATSTIEHATFSDIGRYLKAGDLLVVNETRVITARLSARKIPSGGAVEVLLLRKVDSLTWEVLVGGKGMTRGRAIWIEDRHGSRSGLEAEVVEVREGAQRVLRFSSALEGHLDSVGRVPLPPYIHTSISDPERYQTVFAHKTGSVAAPTAGMHFTPRLISELEEQGIKFAEVVLHIGLDTFAPVNEESPEDHKIHTEWCQISKQAAQAINQARREGGRIVAVGTTSVRTLETAARMSRDQGEPGLAIVSPYEGSTNLFILPGYQFQVVEAMITNFHLPRSTLIMLVSAFAGRERILYTYEVARQNGYRFYSFGDAMMIV